LTEIAQSPYGILAEGHGKEAALFDVAMEFPPGEIPVPGGGSGNKDGRGPGEGLWIEGIESDGKNGITDPLIA